MNGGKFVPADFPQTAAQHTAKLFSAVIRLRESIPRVLRRGFYSGICEGVSNPFPPCLRTRSAQLLTKQGLQRIFSLKPLLADKTRSV